MCASVTGGFQRNVQARVRTCVSFITRVCVRVCVRVTLHLFGSADSLLDPLQD